MTRGNRTRFLLVIAALCCSGAERERFLGIWKNTEASAAIQKAVIRRDGDRLFAQIWASCGGKICDWANGPNGIGEQPARIDAAGALYVDWHFPQQSISQTLAMLPDGGMQAITVAHAYSLIRQPSCGEAPSLQGMLGRREEVHTINTTGQIEERSYGDILTRDGDAVAPPLTIAQSSALYPCGLYGTGGTHPYAWSVTEGKLTLTDSAKPPATATLQVHR